MDYLFAGLIAFLASYLGVFAIRRIAQRRGIVDMPNARSSHQIATPRGGGLAIVVVTLCGFIVWQSGARLEMGWLGYFSAAVLIAVVGLLDDVRSLSVVLRLAMQTLAAAILIVTFGAVDARMLGILPLLLWLVGLTNMYNFMDGIDGIAAGQAVVAAGFWFALALALHVTPIAVLALLLLASSFGFLLHNKPPARIFMGDAGSTFLGFTFAALPLAMYHFTNELQMFALGILFVSPFVFDASLTIARRALRRENIFQAHRTHLYQRLVKIGYSHAAVSWLYVFLALIAGGLGLLAFWIANWAWLCWLVVIVMFLGLWGGVTWLERRRQLPATNPFA